MFHIYLLMFIIQGSLKTCTLQTIHLMEFKHVKQYLCVCPAYVTPDSPQTFSPLGRCPCRRWCRADLLRRPGGSRTEESPTRRRWCRRSFLLLCGERCSRNLQRTETPKEDITISYFPQQLKLAHWNDWTHKHASRGVWLSCYILNMCWEFLNNLLFLISILFF